MREFTQGVWFLQQLIGQYSVLTEPTLKDC